MPSDAFSEIERELLAHSSWVRRLARSLVASEADAEELVQDTWVAALRRPPIEGSPARPWIARVVRNLAARRWRRSSVQLEAPETLSASEASSTLESSISYGTPESSISYGTPESASSCGTEDPLDFAARLETQRILVEELQALSEPARRVIVLRYFDGLDAAEIARRTGEAHGTVRWRLHEALAALRTRLDRRHGGSRETWMSALALAVPELVLPQPTAELGPQATSAPTPSPSLPAPHAVPHDAPLASTPSAATPSLPAPHIVPHTAPQVPAPALAPAASPLPTGLAASLAASTGILAVNTLVKIAVAITVLLALSVGVYVTTQDAPPAPVLDVPPRVQAAPSAAASAHEPLKAELASVASSTERAAVEAPVPAATQPAPAANPLRARLVARALDERLRPLPNAWLSASRASKNGIPEASDSVARAGLDGELEIDVDAAIAGGATGFVAGCEGFATRWLRVKLVPGETAYAGDIVFLPAGTVAGRVLDEHGQPLQAEIAVTTPSEGHASGDLELMRLRGPEFDIGAPTGKCGADGRFRVGGVPVGLARVWAHAPGMRWSVSAPVEVTARHESGDIELVLEREIPGAAKFGPIEGIVLAPDETPVKSPNIDVLYSEGNTSTSHKSPGQADGRFKIVPSGRGPHELTFADRDARYTPVRLKNIQPGTHGLVVRLGQPQPIAVVVRSHGEPVTDFKLTWREVGAREEHADKNPKAHPDGRAVLMAPAASFTFSVDADGYLPRTLGPYDGRRAPAEIEVVLEPVPGVHGRVLGAGLPIAGARVWLQTYARRMLVQVDEFDLWVEPREQFVTTSDADGRFRIGLQHDGEFMLFAEAAGWAKCELGPLELAAGTGQKGIELALDKGGIIEGRVLVSPGRSPAGTIVGANHGDGKPRTQTVGPDGRFRFAELTPGKWKVMRCRSDFTGGSSTATSSGDDIVGGTIDTNCVVASGRTTTFDVDLRESGPCTVDVELKLNGEPAKAWSVTLRPSGVFAIARELPYGATDAQGRVRIETDEPGQYDVEIVPPAEHATALEIGLSVDLARGTTPLVRDLKTGRVEGTIASWRDDSEHGWRYQSGTGADFQASIAIHADASGHFVLPIVPLGAGEILRDVATEPRTANYVPVAKLDVEAGKTQTVSLP